MAHDDVLVSSKDKKRKNIMIKKKISLLVEHILDFFLRFDKFQNYVNNRANVRYGFKFVNTPNNGTINQVFSDYRFNDIRKTDKVLDIGANVGAFSMFISRMVKQVYAIEPITTNILSKNIDNNNIKNITVIQTALGDTNKASWLGETKTIKTFNLTSIIGMCNEKIDFLKLDCEGGEWSIKPEDLKGIRRIEAEIHNMNNTRNVLDFLKVLDDAKFIYTYEIGTEMNVHAERNNS